MKRILTALLCALCLAMPAAAQFSLTECFRAETIKNDRGETLPVRVWRKYDKADLPVPVVVMLHGSGQCGTDNINQLGAFGALHHEILTNTDLPPALWAIPQCSQLNPWIRSIAFEETYRQPRYPAPSLRLVKEWLDDLIEQGIADPERIYIGGYSLGGFGTWDAIQRWPNYFAGALPICGGGSVQEDPMKHAATTSIWVFHGSADGAVPVACSRRMVAALTKIGMTPLYTEYNGEGHEVWGHVFRDSAVWRWLFRQRRGKPMAATPDSEDDGFMDAFLQQLKAYVTPS